MWLIDSIRLLGDCGEIQTGLKVSSRTRPRRLAQSARLGAALKGKQPPSPPQGAVSTAPDGTDRRPLETGLQLFSGGSQGRKALKLLLKASGAESENAHEAAAQVVRADCMEVARLPGAGVACASVDRCRRQRPSHGSGLQQAPAAPAGQAGAGLDPEAAFAASDIRWIGVIGQPLDQAAIAPCWGSAEASGVDSRGATRQESVERGLRLYPAMSMCSFMTEPAVNESALLHRCARAVQEGAL